MELAPIKSELAKRLTSSRYEHVLRVAQLSKEMAKQHGVSEIAAEQAALFHDIAKCMKKEELLQRLQEADEDKRLVDFHHELWHGPVGAIIAQETFGIIDEDILNAVRFHTTGRANMSRLEKIVFIADLIEPGRQFPGVNELRERSKGSIDEAMYACISHSIEYLVSKRVAIFPDSFDCYNEYMLKEGII
ncbi:bis(5'-nucleosyl)-tetraphosphatase (symmetrical) YqeK [Sporosarcina pasteurii]|uniref:bis(5'-nucleosyl)-tetraphosphatase (symmetrical) n=1 Tax=Sporosarcina pasteurii TaxID=1474 RepID=A0A380BPR0_SPOPA|nr:bis(5'-nucleosyl)-tetraphosphatase (symmetrical) YqeK [Sporosarcina pasteurii]MDS9470999.1 bis(5'-nucleosyl)-tetraphosphatase (symmetrical) YqeK [Sporosarcina pasteurii]QBQ05352.1 HD domain-containing protein [Sporosarcina pasteurii]SUJ03832.1 putative nicotinate-nucleotide adenylyltransferase [Sporosarcina pasteurii]